MTARTLQFRRFACNLAGCDYGKSRSCGGPCFPKPASVGGETGGHKGRPYDSRPRAAPAMPYKTVLKSPSPARWDLEERPMAEGGAALPERAITVSESAAKRIAEVAKAEGAGEAFLRIAVSGGG